MGQLKNKKHDKDVGSRISASRREAGFDTSIKFAERYNFDHQTLRSIESGHLTVNTATLKWFAETLNVSSDYLLGISRAPSLDDSVQAVVNKYGLDEKSLKTLEFLAAPSPVSNGFRDTLVEAYKKNPTKCFALLTGEDEDALRLEDILRQDTVHRRRSDCLDVLNWLLQWEKAPELLALLHDFVAFFPFKIGGSISVKHGDTVKTHDATPEELVEFAFLSLKRALDEFRNAIQTFEIVKSGAPQEPPEERS